MSKVKYVYDSEKLAYRKIKTKKAKSFGYAALFLVASALFGFLCFVVLLNTPYFETPKDRLQSREVENLKINYAVLKTKMSEMETVLERLEERDDNVYRTYFNSAPKTTTNAEKKGFLTKERYKDLEGFNNSDLVIATSKELDGVLVRLVEHSKSLDEIVKLAKGKEKLLAAIPAIQPVKNEELRQMASGFGYRNDPFTKIRKFHKGMDFTARTGTPIYATGDGVVVKADASLSGYGKHIQIKHGFGYKTLYAHLSKYKVRQGQRVKRGDIIGYVGSSGRSEAPHLHYEVYQNGKVVNPLNFYYGSISAKEYVLIADRATQENQSLD